MLLYTYNQDLDKTFYSTYRENEKECKCNFFSLTKIIHFFRVVLFFKASNYWNLNVYRTSVNKIKIWGVLEIFNIRL